MAFGVPADNVDTSFSVADGALTLDKLSVHNVAGAEITATGRADGSLSDYKGSGEITFKAADPGPFFKCYASICRIIPSWTGWCAMPHGMETLLFAGR